VYLINYIHVFNCIHLHNSRTSWYLIGYTGDMGSKANEMTPLATQIMRECIRLQKASGMTVADFAKACGFSRDYWYKHANLSRPLNIGDLERISQVTGISPGDIVMNSQRHAVEAAERKAQAGGYGLAAYNTAGKQEAINGEAGPDYDEPA
jgi:hypothetical protein